MFCILEICPKRFPLSPPPDTSGGNISIIHIVKKLYATIYLVSNKLQKRDKLGIHLQIERLALDIMSGIVKAYFSPKNKKLSPLETTRVSLEILKHLVRTEYELKIIEEKAYIRIESLIVEISKMTNGWIKYLAQTPRL